jgi:hypothetical protein
MIASAVTQSLNAWFQTGQRLPGAPCMPDGGLTAWFIWRAGLSTAGLCSVMAGAALATGVHRLLSSAIFMGGDVIRFIWTVQQNEIV